MCFSGSLSFVFALVPVAVAASADVIRLELLCHGIQYDCCYW